MPDYMKLISFGPVITRLHHLLLLTKVVFAGGSVVVTDKTSEHSLWVFVRSRSAWW